MIKQFIAWAISWSLFWLGHACSKLCIGWLGWIFSTPYIRLMGWSLYVQIWGGDVGPWGKPEDTA